MYRIADLLQTEYRNFHDDIIVESSFAQVNRNGSGIRQVQLALTNTKFIVATDVFWPSVLLTKNYRNGQQPFHISLELDSVIPLDLLKMRMYTEEPKRCILKVEYCTKRVLFFELGGFIHRHLDWCLWKDSVDAIRIGQKRKPSKISVSHSSCSSSDVNYGNHQFQCSAEVHHPHKPILTTRMGKNSMRTSTFVERDIEEDKKNVLRELCKVLALRMRSEPHIEADTGIGFVRNKRL